jgi:ATP-dependent helicase/nuclease subunit A
VTEIRDSLGTTALPVADAVAFRPVDDDVRQRATTDLDTTFLVEAGAGTGKTSVLVDRYLACLSGPDAPPITSVVAITFTEKAAGELRQRIRGALEARLAGGDPAGAPLAPSGRDRLAAALDGLDDAPISTIHAFAARLLRERPVEAGVDPAFTQLDQVGSELLRERLWRDWLSALLDDDQAAGASGAERPETGLDTDHGTGPDHDTGPVDIGPDRAADPDKPGVGIAALLAEILRAGVSIEQVARLAGVRFAERYAVDGAAPSAAPALGAAIAALKVAAAAVAEATRECADDADRLKCGSLGLAGAVAALPGDGDLHELGRALTALAGRAGSLTARNAGKGANWPGGKDAMLAARDALRDDLRAAADAYGAYVVGLALAVAADFSCYASQAQGNAGALDFDDLLGRARNLLSGVHEPDKARVVATRRHFQRRYRYLLLDEFQDTDPLQAEIAFLLAEREPTAKSWRDVELRPGKLFLVGDPKQSIYRFRRADIGMYDEVKGLLTSQGGEVLKLRQNFRTVASVVGWVNGAFGELIGPNELLGLQPAYSALTPARADGEPGRNVVVVAAPTEGAPDAGGKVRPPTPADLCRREADLIAALLTDMDRLGWKVHAGKHPHGIWRTAQPGDVAILMPTFTFVGFYEQALREAGLPYRVDGGRTFFNRREVLDTLAVLQALDTAADPVAVYSALHGQLFAFSDDDLYEFHAAGGIFDYLGAAPPAGFSQIAAALADLRALHERRNLRPPAETLDDLVRRTGLLESLALWADDPDQAIGNIAELVSLADEFAQSAEATFHAFVAKTAHDVSAADTAESPVGEPGAFVRLMTVHKAKGLEFPIVVLAGAMRAARSASRDPLVDRVARRLDCALTCPSLDPGKPGATARLQTAGYEPRFALEKQALEHERVRLLYVALTRAADLLVLPVVTAEPGAGSLQSLWQATLPEGVIAAAVASPGSGEPDDAPGGPFDETGAAAGDSFLRVERWLPHEVAARPAPTVAPDADPLPLREAWRKERGALLARASRAAPIFAPSSLERLEAPDWSDGASLAPSAAPPAAAAAPAPTPADLAPATADLASPPLAAPAGLASGAVGPGRGRAHALALGTAVHLVLERVALEDDGELDGLAVQAAVQAGVPGDADRVATLARACWRAEPLRGAARSAHHRELPVCACHGDVLIEGAIDLIYRDDELGGWVVVDYKTDAQPRPDAVRAQYGGQAGAYALAFEAAGGGPVVAVRVLLAALPDAAGAATVVDLPVDQALRDLVELRLLDAAGRAE